jgi:hypothetical protein
VSSVNKLSIFLPSVPLSLISNIYFLENRAPFSLFCLLSEVTDNISLCTFKEIQVPVGSEQPKAVQNKS